MYEEGYFPTTGGGGGGGDVDLGTLPDDVASLLHWRDVVVPAPYRTSTLAWNDLVTTLEQSTAIALEVEALKDDHITPLETWRNTVVPAPYRTSTQAWNDLLTKDEVRTEAQNLSTDPNDHLLTHGDYLASFVGVGQNFFGSKGDVDRLLKVMPRTRSIAQTANDEPLSPPGTGALEPFTTYVCWPTTTFTFYPYNWFYFENPAVHGTGLEDEPYTFLVVNAGTQGIKLRVVASSVANRQAIFVRGTKTSSRFAHTLIPPGHALRFTYVPASYNLWNAPGRAVYIEEDVDANEALALMQPIDPLPPRLLLDSSKKEQNGATPPG